VGTIRPTLNTFLLLTLLNSISVSGALPSWLEPVKGNTPKEEIQCYSIPYGGIGFASHILTYYTLTCLILGKKPLCPTRPLKHIFLDSVLAIFTFIITVGVAIFTIIRCQNQWEYMLIAIWKIFMTTVVVSTTVTAPVLLKYYGQENSKKSAWCLALYVPGIVVGFVGLVPLVKQSWSNHTIGIITYVFGGVIVGLGIAIVAYSTYNDPQKGDGGLLFCSGGITMSWFWGLSTCIGVWGVLGVLYSDWILGCIAEDLAGLPSSDNAILYWTYFIAKRLPLFSL
jgi:hypothetical protein